MAMVEEKPAIVFVREEVAEIILLVATDKGAFLYFADSDRRHWDVSGPHFMGSVIHHLVLDPRDDAILLVFIRQTSRALCRYVRRQRRPTAHLAGVHAQEASA